MRAAGTGGETDRRGVASLHLRPGPQALVVSRLGIRSDSLRIEVRVGMDTMVDLRLETESVELAPVTVSTTRLERRVVDEPERVEVLAREDVAEGSQMHPGDLTVLLSEMSGVRYQPGAGGGGGASLRFQRLPGEHTAVLVDGLPLFGADPTGLSLLQVPPLDLAQAEVIKGAVTALHGPAAGGGVVNLISRRPDTGSAERTLLLNATSRSGGDGALWVSRQLDERWGYTLLAGGHHQAPTDVDHDGWADLAGYERGEVRPRVFWRGTDGSTVMATLGALAEHRLAGSRTDAPSGSPYRSDLHTRRGDGGLVARIPLGATHLVTVRGAGSGQWQRYFADVPDLGVTPHTDHRATIFGEVPVRASQSHGEWLVGAAWEQDRYQNDDLAGLDYRYTTPSLLAQGTLSPSPGLSATATARLDRHGQYGSFVSPRISVLTRISRILEARVSAGAGFSAPTPFTDETRPIPLANLTAPGVWVSERPRSASLDLTYRDGFLEVSGAAFASVLDHAVALREVPDQATGRLSLVNAPGPLRTAGAELFSVFNREPIAITAYYAYLRASEVAPETGARLDVPLDPRHTAGMDIAWEEDNSGTRAGFEVFYTGRQSVEHDPLRSTSPRYTTLGVLVSQRLGLAMVFLNAENLSDVRQARWGPVSLDPPGPGGRVTTDIWAPLEGRVFNAGIRFTI